MEQTLAVFAKRPEPGRVKTRLVPALGTDAAASLYVAMLRDVWTLAAQCCEHVVLFIDEPWDGFDDLAGSRQKLQSTGDLGSRMYRCLKELTKSAASPSVIIGSDSPTLPMSYIEKAFRRITDADDAVLGPTEDGGYYLVGCRRAHPTMFSRVGWSTPSTLAETQEALRLADYNTKLTEPWYDVDEPRDVLRLAADPSVGVAVSDWLADNTHVLRRIRAGESPG